jgi:O-antigen/teichoic acid export membrane protein
MAIKIGALYNDKLVKTSSLLFIATMITNISNYAFQIVMGRLLTTIEYGLMNALLSLFTVLAVPISTLLMVVARKTSEYKAKDDFAGINHLYGMTTRRVLVFGLIGLTIFIVCSPVIRDYIHAPSVIPVIILGLSIVTALAYPVNLAVLQGVQDYKWLSINQGIGGPAKLFFTVLFVAVGFSVNGVMSGLIASSLLLWFISYLPVRKLVKREHGGSTSVEHISFSKVWPVFLSVFSFSVLTQADIVLVSRYFPSHDAGLYASAAIIGKAVMYIPGAIVLAMFPMVSEQHALRRSSRHLLFKSLALTFGISGFGALAIYLFPQEIISLIYGARYSEAHQVFKYYGIAMLPMAFLMVLMNYLIAKGNKLLAYIMSIGALIEIVVLMKFRSDLQVIVYDLLVVGIGVLLISLALLALLSQSSGDSERLRT